MAVGNVKGFKVKKGNETGVAKIATEAYLDESVTKAKLATAVQDTLDEVPNKADANGDYDDLTAGGAKQLLSTVYVDNKVPYNFRTSGGTADIGDRMYDEVVGGTVVWNQLYTNNNFETRTGWAANNDTHGVVSATDNVLTLTLGANLGTSTYLAQYISPRTKLWNGHVYVQMIDVNPSKDTACEFMYGGVATGAGYTNVSANTWTRYGDVIKMTSDYSAALFYINWNGQLSEGDTVQFKNAFLCDLTQMFGSTIADYIYSLEQGTVGAGVTWFRNLFPKPYYEYNAGELMSVKAGSHDTVGFNQINNLVTGQLVKKVDGTFQNNADYARTDYIRVFPNTTYYFKEDNVTNGEWAAYYDANKVFVSGTDLYPNNTFTTPSNAYYLITSLRVESVNNVCINLSWDGEKDGQYEPYEKHEYPLDELELRGVPKLDANNQLYYDGDTYASDGTVTRKYGIVDLGTLSWRTSNNTTIYQAQVAGMFQPTDPNDRLKGMICSKYQVDTVVAININNMTDKTYKRAWGEFFVRDDSYSTAADFKSAMSGVYLVYELATPTTETADAFTNPQVVDDFGTEEYVDYAVEAGDRDVAIPVGHNSQYMNNLRAKLEMAPDSPDGDGDYIVRQNNGENSYVPYTADGRLDALEAKLPAPPSTNGTYKLTATVTDGVVTYTWTAG